jgi:TolB-like protein/DNA-binding winged helix-turn-helix (wHTH) protein
LLLSTPGKTFPILLTLIENREGVVTIAKLVNSFFPKSDFAEEELTSEVLRLKRLLDDTSKQAPIVRTISGRGYQFEAEVTEYLGDSTSDQKFGNRPADAEWELRQKPPETRRKMLGTAAAVILLAALGIGVWHFMPARSGASMANDTATGSDAATGNEAGTAASDAATASEAPTVSNASTGTPQVAILPFQSLTGAASDDSFNRSLTEAIIKTLGKQSKVQVVSAASVQRYLASGAADPVTAGRELGAQMIVRGMAQRLAGRILVKVQLVSTEDGSQIWSTTFEGDSNEIAGLSAKICEKIVK